MVSSITSATDTTALTMLQKMLAEADKNADGVVDEGELTSALTSGTDAAATAATVIAEVDSDGSGTVTLSEFSSFVEKFAADTGMALLSAQEESSALTSLFTGLDTDGDAQLSASEIAAGLTAATAAEETTTEETTETETAAATTAVTTEAATATAETLIASVDVNGDGTFNKNDVASLFLKASQIMDEKTSASDADSLLTATYDRRDTDKDGTVTAAEEDAAG